MIMKRSRSGTFVDILFEWLMRSDLRYHHALGTYMLACQVVVLCSVLSRIDDIMWLYVYAFMLYVGPDAVFSFIMPYY